MLYVSYVCMPPLLFLDLLFHWDTNVPDLLGAGRGRRARHHFQRSLLPRGGIHTYDALHIFLSRVEEGRRREGGKIETLESGRGKEEGGREDRKGHGEQGKGGEAYTHMTHTTCSSPELHPTSRLEGRVWGGASAKAFVTYSPSSSASWIVQWAENDPASLPPRLPGVLTPPPNPHPLHSPSLPSSLCLASAATQPRDRGRRWVHRDRVRGYLQGLRRRGDTCVCVCVCVSVCVCHMYVVYVQRHSRTRARTYTNR